MVKYLFLVLTLVFGSLAGIYFFVGVPRIYETEFPVLSIPHVYNNPSKSLERIHVVAFYFVPADARESQIADWKQVLETNLQKLKEFHEHQFLGRSQFSFQVYPEPIEGLKTRSEYEGVSAVAAELEELVASASIVLVMYEGGEEATGSEGNEALIARTFLTDEAYAPFHATFLAHEFYHTLAVPDRYTPSSRVFSGGEKSVVGIVSSGDVMGRIRVPLEQTYLARDTLAQMGL